MRRFGRKSAVAIASLTLLLGGVIVPDLAGADHAPVVFDPELVEVVAPVGEPVQRRVEMNARHDLQVLEVATAAGSRVTVVEDQCTGRTVAVMDWCTFDVVVDARAAGVFVDEVSVTVAVDDGSGDTTTSSVPLGVHATVGDRPNEPRQVYAARSAEATSCELTWLEAEPTDPAVQSYDVEVFDDQASVVFAEQVRAHGEPTYALAVGGLEPARMYSFFVTARNELGTGPTAQTTCAGAAVPSEPARVQTEPDSAGAIVVRWDPPFDDGGAPVTGYQVSRSPQFPDGPVTTSALELVDTQVSRRSPDGQRNYYSYEVAAVNAVGTGPAYLSVAETPNGPPGPVMWVQGYPGQAVGEIAVSWHGPFDQGGTTNAGPVSYDLIRLDGDERVLVATTQGMSATDTGRPADVDSRYVVVAYNDLGRAADSPVVTVRSGSPPSTPGDPRAVAGPQATRITLSWGPSRSDSMAFIDGYVVERSVDGGAFELLEQVTQPCCGPRIELVDDQARPGGLLHTYRISATNRYGASEPAVVSVRSVGPPAPPQQAAAVVEVSGTQVSWQPPGDDGGSPVSAYVIGRSTRGGAFERIGQVAAGTLQFVDVTRQPAGQHRYQVAAVNAAGVGSAVTVVPSGLLAPLF